MNGKGRIDMSFFMKHKAQVQLMLLAAAALHEEPDADPADAEIGQRLRIERGLHQRLGQRRR